MGNQPSTESSRRRRGGAPDTTADKAKKMVHELNSSLNKTMKKLEDSSLLDTVCGPFFEEDKTNSRRSSTYAYSEDISEEDSRTVSEDETNEDSAYHNRSSRGRKKYGDSGSLISQSDYESEPSKIKEASFESEEDSTYFGKKKKKRDLVVTDRASDVGPGQLAKPLASSFAKRCYFTKAGIGKTTQHYEGLTLTGNIVLMLAAAMKLKGCPTICDEDLRRVEQTYPNQFSRLPDELLLSSGWRRISKYCHFSNKPIPDGVPFFHSRERSHPSGGYYFLLAAAVGMIRPIDVEPLTRDTLVLLETDYPSQCDAAPSILIQDPSEWTLVDKFCFFSGGPINAEEDVYYQADFDGNPIFMLAFLSPSLTPEELYKLQTDLGEEPGLKTIREVEDVESVYDLTERDFDDLKLYHLGPCRALPPYVLQPQAWSKVLPPHFLAARQRAMMRAQVWEEKKGIAPRLTDAAPSTGSDTAIMMQDQTSLIPPYSGDQVLPQDYQYAQQVLPPQNYQFDPQAMPPYSYGPPHSLVQEQWNNSVASPPQGHMHQQPIQGLPASEQPGHPQAQPISPRHPQHTPQPPHTSPGLYSSEHALPQDYRQSPVSHANTSPSVGGGASSHKASPRRHHHMAPTFGSASGQDAASHHEFQRQIEEEGAFVDDNAPLDEALAQRARMQSQPPGWRQESSRAAPRMDPPEDEPPSLSKQEGSRSAHGSSGTNESQSFEAEPSESEIYGDREDEDRPFDDQPYDRPYDDRPYDDRPVDGSFQYTNEGYSVEGLELDQQDYPPEAPSYSPEKDPQSYDTREDEYYDSPDAEKKGLYPAQKGRYYNEEPMPEEMNGYPAGSRSYASPRPDQRHSTYISHESPRSYDSRAPSTEYPPEYYESPERISEGQYSEPSPEEPEGSPVSEPSPKSATSGAIDSIANSEYTPSSAVRAAQDLLRKTRHKRNQRSRRDYSNSSVMSTDDKSEVTFESASVSEVATSIISGSSVWTDGSAAGDRSSRRALILQMAKARMKSGGKSGGASVVSRSTGITQKSRKPIEEEEEVIEEEEPHDETEETKSEARTEANVDIDFTGELD